jgi:mono/diheme cytochrome c family protein
MLAGRVAATAPYGWDGEGRDLEHHLEHTFERLGGTGLTSIELRSLLAYVSTLTPPPAGAARREAEAVRGEAIFRSERAGCASCHAATSMTDGKRHDVRTQAKADKTPTFDTPSLRFVGGRAPYFHDGRYATLRALLTGSDGTMGHTSHLTASELDALEAYLRSL